MTDIAKGELERNITLTHFILESGRQAREEHPEITGQLSILLHAIEIASKYTASKVSAAGLLKLLGLEGSENVQGEEVKKLDVVANEAFITSLRRSGTVQVMVSEENEQPITITDSKGHYACCFDPLDGSSNIDANVSIGTIFAINRMDPNKKGVANVLRPGKELVAAGYTMYGSATMMVISIGKGVHGFTLDPSSGEFVLTHHDIKMPAHRKIYSVNEAYSPFWFDPIKNYINFIKSDEKNVYSQRYVGSMVADVHRTLLYGGIFLYPSDKRSSVGKLRLLYEANPMAFLIEQAGGSASDGKTRILDIMPDQIHQRVPIFLGSKKNMEELEKFFK